MTHEELMNTPEYCTTMIQLELFNRVEQYMKEKGINRTELAKELGVSKGYVSQILNGDYDHRLSKFVELAIKVGLKPAISFSPISNELKEEEKIQEILGNAQLSVNQVGYMAMFTEINKFSKQEIKEFPPCNSNHKSA